MTALLIALLGVALVASLVAVVVLGLALRSANRRAAGLEAEFAALAADVPDAEPQDRRSRAVRRAEQAVRTGIKAVTTVRERGVGGLLVGSLDDLSRWASEDRSEIARLSAGDGSVTILFSDIEGSTTMNDSLGDERWVELLIAHDAMVRAHVDHRDGHVVKSQGDGFMVVFGSPVAAARAALDIQRTFALTRARLLRRTPINVRIGIHTGAVVARNGDFFGLNVAIAARVAAQAQGSQTLVTDEVADLLRHNPRFALVDAGEAELKGVPGLRRLWLLDRAARRRG